MTMRFLPFQSHPGSYNMALDEAILESHLAGQSDPTLRFYGFSPPAVTLGYAQKLDDFALSRIQSEGFDVVRRATGGRAVLHYKDLTYSFVGSDQLLGQSVNDAYKKICSALILGLTKLGLDVQVGKSGQQYKHVQDCFLSTTSADLHLAGLKMIGSAQLRRLNAVLQHGSILLDQDQDLMPRLLGLADDPAKSSKRHSNLFQALARTVSIEEIQEAIRLGFEENFQQSFNIGVLSEAELNCAAKLRSKYEIETYAERCK